MAKANSARGRSPLPPAEKQFASSPTLTVPETGKARSKSRSKSRSKNKTKSKAKELSYKSDGVEDHDVFLLPVSDYWVILALTLLALAVRVYKIYQPSSVVFDEVQLVSSALTSAIEC
jgi:dolichyl-phosphate-mannose-protein mannosyltransferase